MQQIKIPDCSLGVNKDLMPEELAAGAWSDAKNMRSYRGFMERIGGFYDQFDAPSVTPYYIAPYQTSTVTYWIHAGLANVYADDGTARTNVTPASPFTGAIDNRFSGGTLSGIHYINNGVEVPHYWAGDTLQDFATLTNWTANWKCRALRPFREFLFAVNMTEGSFNYPHKVRWSSAVQPGSIPDTWDYTDATREAGYVELADTTDPLVDALPLGDALIIYGERSMHRASYIGGDAGFQFQRIPTVAGLLNVGCVVDTPVGHVFLSVGDVYLFDGVSAPQSIATGQVRDWIFETMDSENYERSFLVTNPNKGELLICFPSSGKSACDKAAVWNWTERKWGTRDLPLVTYGAHGPVADASTSTAWNTYPGITWATINRNWVEESIQLNTTTTLFTRTYPAISAYDYGGQDEGVDMSSYLERTGIGFDDTVKQYTDISINVDAPVGTLLTVYLGAAMVQGKAPTYQAGQTFTVGTSYKINAIAKGRSAAIKITHTGEAQWRIRSYSIGVQPAGRY